MRGIQWLVLCIGLCGLARGQETEGFERFPLRVSSKLPGREVEVDRGSGIRLQPGDTIVFETRDGVVLQGRVVKVLDRKSIVETVDVQTDIPLGTRGHALIPKARLRREETQEDVDPEGEAMEPEVDHDPWTRLEDDWTAKDPLLARIQPLRPEERDTRYGGRAYGIFEQRLDTQADRSELYMRTGTDLWMSNPFGRGGSLRLDMEVNRFNYDLPELGDDTGSNLRVDRFSYARGVNRYQPDRFDSGRFLVHAIPEQGLVDGVSASRRLPNGHSFGVSLGGLPEPNPRQDSGQDVGISAFYRWVADETERWTAAVALQKTWHNGSQDRDLIIAKTDWMPVNGWQMHANAWVDLYGSDDLGKGTGPELTRMYVSTRRDWSSKRGVHGAVSIQKYPSLLRDEFLLPAPDTVAREHVHRMSAGVWQQLDESRRLTLDGGVWEDDDDAGGDLDLGLDIEDFGLENGRLGVHLFQTRGEFSTHVGARVTVRQFLDQDQWSVLVETTKTVQDDFDPTADTFYQHRIRGTYQFQIDPDWQVSLFGEDTILEDDSSFLVGFQFDRSF
ncbi:MAG: hypothetical protein KDB61_02360 [Planctomycetes bacterium]|nr:hypothetical protein [Planctomycetota bacterium]